MKITRCLITGFYICLLLAQPSMLFADFGSQDKGTSSAHFLMLGVGARAMGMGEAYSAVVDEASALYWNPAGLTRVQDRSVIFMYAILLDSFKYNYLGYGQRLGNSGAFGASIQYLSAETIKETDSSGFETGTSFSPKDFAFSLGYSHRVKEFDMGIAVKYIYSEIIESASTFAIDAGILSPSYAIWGKDVKFSFVTQNLGKDLKFEQDSDPLPLNIKLGTSLPIDKNWIAALDFNFPRDNNPNIALGTEYRISYGTDWNFSGRLGFNSRTIGDVDGLTGFSFGIGTGFRQIELDYAFIPLGSIGRTHRISVTAKF